MIIAIFSAYLGLSTPQCRSDDFLKLDDIRSVTLPVKTSNLIGGPRRSITGKAVVSITVSKEGVVNYFQVSCASSEQFAKSALIYLKTLKFVSSNKERIFRILVTVKYE